MRFWISWVQRTEDYRPLTDPPNRAILGWWCSGYDADDNAVLCAAVEARDALQASVLVFADWPEAMHETWRFHKPVAAEWRPSDRFPLKPWMIERFCDSFFRGGVT